MKKEIIEKLTESVLEAMENPGKRQQLWNTRGARNAKDGRKYHGMNKIILSYKMNQESYKENRRATYKQIAEAGGQVKKGEKGTTVYFRQFFTDKLDDTKRIPMVKLYTVFNLDQQEGAEFKDESTYNHEEIYDAEMVIIEYLAREEILEKYGDPAYYVGDDYITMPKLHDFKDAQDYYASFFHQMIHSTGADNRLKRSLQGQHNREDYSKEELTAEFGACFLMQEAGQTFELNNHAQYIAGRAKAIQKEGRQTELFQAIGRAEKASQFVLIGKQIKNG
jgi:antirestriction protein ArdC